MNAGTGDRSANPRADRELQKFASYGSAYLGIPVPAHKKAWSCHACGNEWQQTDDPVANAP